MRKEIQSMEILWLWTQCACISLNDSIILIYIIRYKAGRGTDKIAWSVKCLLCNLRTEFDY